MLGKPHKMVSKASIIINPFIHISKIPKYTQTKYLKNYQYFNYFITIALISN